MKIANSILDLIGKTPMVKINKLTQGLKATIIAKLESFNPMGSVKDRIAFSMISQAEKSGILNQESTIVEATSGNTGIGLAFICAQKGYKLILSMPETMSLERRQLLRALGAHLLLTPGEKGMKGAIEKAQEIIANTKNAIMLDQFSNPSNPLIHEETTAIEIWNSTEGNIDFIVSGVGTGGTLTGISKKLKQMKNSLKIVAVEPFQSAVLSGKPPGKHSIQGIGAGFIPKILEREYIDEIITVKDHDAKLISKRLALEEGLLVGISSGAAMWGALQIAQKAESENKIICVIFPDTGERYLSTGLFE